MSTALSNDIPLAKLKLDANEHLIRLIEIANKAILDVVRAFPDADDPVSASLLGADPLTLKTLANITNLQINPLLRTGIPIFSIPMANEEMSLLINKKESSEGIFKCFLKTCSDDIQLKSI